MNNSIRLLQISMNNLLYKTASFTFTFRLLIKNVLSFKEIIYTE